MANSEYNNGVELSKSELRKLQLIQLELLVELDRVCRKNHIRYVMDGGTMIGAVRHHGFIPWDDDIDVAMLREDYEKLKTVLSDFDSKLCFFQDHTTDPNYRWGYGKLRRVGTSYVRLGQEHLKQKDGVFIDIFPFDDVPRSTFGQVVQDWYLFALRKILWSEVGRKSVGGVWRMWWTLLSCIPPRFVFALLDGIARKSRNCTPNRVRILMFPAFGLCGKKGRMPISERYGLQKSVFNDPKEFLFEGRWIYGYSDYDTRLKMEYGDYMQLPPESEREPHLHVSSYKF